MNRITIASQPDDVTCGPTCLHAVYQYFNDEIPLKEVISEVTYLDEGGTLGVLLGLHALKRGYNATIYTYNLQLFDPAWFSSKNRANLVSFLKEQKKFKQNKKIQKASTAYIEFLQRGGELKFKDLTPNLLKSFFEKNIPVLTGLNSTYLYNSPREFVDSDDKITYDSIKGTSSGHFVILGGYDDFKKRIIVADPYSDNPLSYGKYYAVNSHRLINSIMLGIITFDANLLIIQPGK